MLNIKNKRAVRVKENFINLAQTSKLRNCHVVYDSHLAAAYRGVMVKGLRSAKQV